MQDSELNSVLQAISGALISKWEVIAPGIGLLVFALWVLLRTGSSHVVSVRIWQLVIGKCELKSAILLEYFADRDTLMYFRAVSGITQISSTTAAERLVRWTQIHGADMDLVKGAGRRFDVEELKLNGKVPGAWHVTLLLALSAFLLYAAIATAAWRTTTPALIRVIKSGTWYAVADDQTRRYELWKNSVTGFASSQCNDRSSIAKSTNYPAYDITVLCELLTGESGGAYLHNARIGQLVVTICLVLPLLFFAATTAGAIRRTEKAARLQKLMKTREATVRIDAEKLSLQQAERSDSIAPASN